MSNENALNMTPIIERVGADGLVVAWHVSQAKWITMHPIDAKAAWRNGSIALKAPEGQPIPSDMKRFLPAVAE